MWESLLIYFDESFRFLCKEFSWILIRLLTIKKREKFSPKKFKTRTCSYHIFIFLYDLSTFLSSSSSTTITTKKETKMIMIKRQTIENWNKNMKLDKILYSFCSFFILLRLLVRSLIYKQKKSHLNISIGIINRVVIVAQSCIFINSDQRWWWFFFFTKEEKKERKREREEFKEEFLRINAYIIGISFNQFTTTEWDQSERKKASQQLPTEKKHKRRLIKISWLELWENISSFI